MLGWCELGQSLAIRKLIEEPENAHHSFFKSSSKSCMLKDVTVKGVPIQFLAKSYLLPTPQSHMSVPVSEL